MGWWCGNWYGGFFPRIPGRINDDGHAQSRPIRLVEVQAEPQRHMLAGPHSHTMDVGVGHLGEHPTNVDPHHWFLETLLRHKCANGLQLDNKSWRLLLCSMGRGCTSPMQCSRRKRVLGRILLWRPGTVNLSHSVDRLGRTDRLHMGRFCVHVHRNPAGHATPCQAQETMETSPCWSRIKSLAIQPHHCSSAS